MMREEEQMLSRTLLLAATITLLGVGLAPAQQSQPHQSYDTLGSPTPRPNQEASPNEKEPNAPVPAGGVKPENLKPDTQTTGSGQNNPSREAVPQGLYKGNAQPPSTADTGQTPSGLTRD
jgi:hypothetical protein